MGVCFSIQCSRQRPRRLRSLRDLNSCRLDHKAWNNHASVIPNNLAHYVAHCRKQIQTNHADQITTSTLRTMLRMMLRTMRYMVQINVCAGTNSDQSQSKSIVEPDQFEPMIILIGFTTIPTPPTFILLIKAADYVTLPNRFTF